MSDKIIAIIPARGGSKGIKKKNCIKIAKIPLVAHTIKHAKECSSIQRVIVSTDDHEIANISLRCKAEVFIRPKEISGDDATSESAIINVLDSLKERENYIPDLIVFLQCTSPIRDRNDIENAIKKIKKDKSDSLFSAVRSDRFLWEATNNQLVSLTYDYINRPRRQDIKRIFYIENGSIFIFRTDIIRKFNNRMGGKISIYEMDYWSMFEIDNLDDLELCEFILKNKKTKDILQ